MNEYFFIYVLYKVEISTKWLFEKYWNIAYFEKISERDWVQFNRKQLFGKFVEVSVSLDSDENLVVVLKRSDGLHVKLADGNSWWGWSANTLNHDYLNGTWEDLTMQHGITKKII